MAKFAPNAMQRTHEAGRTAPLVLELVSGTVILHGEEIELPPREFRLLAALAARVGEPVPLAELMKVVWAEDAEWTAPENLTVLVSKLRRLIDGPTKFGNHITNRRRRGYMLDLDPTDVAIVQPSSDDEASDRVVYLDGSEPSKPSAQISEEIPAPVEPVAEEVPAPLPANVEVPVEIDHQDAPQQERQKHRLGVAALVVTLLAASWSVGYLLSSRDASPTAAARDEPSAPAAQAPEEDQGRGSDGRRDTRDRTATQRTEKRGGNSAPSVVAAPAPDEDTSEASASEAGVPAKNGEQQPAPALPPAPTRYLYHLVNAETGDHFITTDSATVSEQRAKGYVGGPIARIYTTREDNTKAIATNGGSAYIFIGSAPKTEPASQTVALWYSADGEGDFFYTTSESDAKQEGWTGSLIGYVRTP